jgi:hypothetical protein
MPAVPAAATFQHIEETDQIGADIGVRVDKRMADARLGGEMHDMRKAVRSEQTRDRLTIGDVDMLVLETGAHLELGETCFFQARIVIGIEVVETDHPASIGKKPPRHMHADESGGTCD